MKMKTYRRLVSCFLGSAALLAAGAASAHHSFAMFDQTKCRTLTGKVVRFDLAYPHSWIWLNVRDKSGSETRWAFEGLDPASLRVMGWTPRSLKNGETIAISFHPLRDGRPGGAAARVRKQDGSEQIMRAKACAIEQ